MTDEQKNHFGSPQDWADITAFKAQLAAKAAEPRQHSAGKDAEVEENWDLGSGRRPPKSPCPKR